MKKIFVLMLVLFVAFSMFAVDEGVAGASKYKVSFGNGLSYNNKDGIDKVDNTFKFQVVAPVSKIVQFGIEGSFNDVLDADTTGGDVNYWSAVNNYGKVAVGIVPNEKLKVGFYVMGGSEGVSYREEKFRDDTPTAEAMVGNGFFEFSAKLTLQSALFNNKISSLAIKQGVNVGFLGHGASQAHLIYTDFDADNVNDKKLFSGLDGEFKYSDWKYFGEIAVEVPIHTLAGWTNISNFTYGATLAYNVYGTTYSVFKVGNVSLFDSMPAKIGGSVSLENWLKIAPDSSTEFKLTVKPAFSAAQVKYKTAAAIDGMVHESAEFSTKFGLWGKKSIEVANIMGIVPYFELDAAWTLKYTQNLVSNGTTNSGTYTFNSGTFAVDPGVVLGLKFGNWETSIRWNPSATYGIAGASADPAQDDAVAASASNIWNLANWKFSVACEFPPPTK